MSQQQQQQQPPVVSTTTTTTTPTMTTTSPATTTTAAAAPQQEQQQQQHTALIVGLHVMSQQGNARTALAAARQDGFDFVTTRLPTTINTASAAPLSHHNNIINNNSNSNSNNTIPTTTTPLRADMSLEAKWWRTSIVGMTSTTTTTSTATTTTSTTTTTTTTTTSSNHDDEHYNMSMLSLTQQLQWAWHMNLPAVCLPPLPVVHAATTTSATTASATTAASVDATTIAQYAAMVATLSQQALQEAGPSFQLWIPVTVHIATMTTDNQNTNNINNNNNNTFQKHNLQLLQTWQSVSAMAHAPSNVGLLIHLSTSTTTTTTSTTSSMTTTSQQQQQQSHHQQQQSQQFLLYSHLLLLLHNLMACGPIHAIQLQTNQFLINKRGYPTLSKLHQRLVEFILLRIGRSVRWLLVQQQQQQQQQQRQNGMDAANDGDINNNNNHLQHLPATSRGMSGCLPYWQYIQHIRQRPAITSVLDSAEAVLEQDYLDVLQKPLQPLKDHLLFSTYETFEKDPVKYQQYQMAVERALVAKHERFPNLKTIAVFVVGAGRGPLVTRVIQAYQVYCQHVLVQQQQQPPKPITVVCVEKNPSAILYLQSKAHHDPLWQLVPILVVQGDLRYLKPEQCYNMAADIVVSELLGSFGCNELSPECLNAFMNGPLAKPHTDSIPCKYVSHLALMSSMHLHNQVRQQAYYPTDDQSGVVGLRTAFETPYVVRTHAASQMQVEQDCWAFEHLPSTAVSAAATTTTTAATTGNRYACLEFGPDISLCGNGYGIFPQVEQQQSNGTTGMQQQQQQQQQHPQSQMQLYAAKQPWVLTGLLGTFTAQLFDDVYISTAPRHFSVGMFSWFPLYFPFHEAIHVPAGAVVQTHIWRKVDPAGSRVWYEWSATVKQGTAVLATTPVHNVNGRSYHVAL